MKKTLLLISASMLCAWIMGFKTAKETDIRNVELGAFSLSLNVQDIEASKSFYEQLGFEAIEGLGDVAQKWIIMSNKTSRIGLFQGFFPSNTITFNPSDARMIRKSFIENEVKPVFEHGFDKDSGPCTMSLVDPDGNTILIDQH